MTQRPSSGQHTTPATVRVNPAAFAHFFQEPSLMKCLVEVIKNTFDAGGSFLNFVTTPDRTILRHFDDGSGMNEANRNAFLSIGFTTTDPEEEGKSGYFGTGAKKLMFTFAQRIKVVTVSVEDPGYVYAMDFSSGQLAEAYAGLATIDVRRVAKNSSTWPHQHQSGTDVTYEFINPKLQSIYRGAALAKKLSERLDGFVVKSGVVRVDGNPLPPKELASGTRPFTFIFPPERYPTLGPLSFDLYSPRRVGDDEALMMTGRQVGEVNFRKDFLDSLTERQRALVPEVFLSPHVCGLIVAGFLNEHITDRRSTYGEQLSSDERVTVLLRILAEIADDVAAHLKIKLQKDTSEETQGKAEVNELLERLQAQYNPEGETPTGPSDSQDDPDGNSEKPKRRGSGTPRVTKPELSLNQIEFGVGEEIVASLKIPTGQEIRNWKFRIDQSLAKLEKQAADHVVLQAETEGSGLIFAYNSATTQTAQVTYSVVPERKFHLSAQGPIGIATNTPFVLRAVNVDKLTSPDALEWHVSEGEGELTVSPDKRSARFISSRQGASVVTATDRAKRLNSDSCQLRIVGVGTENPIKIRDHYFRVIYTPTVDPKWYKPATIEPTPDSNGIYVLVFNPNEPSYQCARQNGSLQVFLAYAIAFEYIKHFALDWVDGSLDIQGMAYYQNAASALCAEMLSGS